MPNRLAGETSPYLLEHASNPVDWYPWGEAALRQAAEADRPILLSIGYSACHWCHVMARESFADPETAALMNRLFVCIKVDREERPDLDQIYMRAVQGLTGSGGWPMTVFLLPDGTPFFGGTYFPPTDRHGLPGFRRVLTAVADAYRTRRSEVHRTAAQVRRLLERSAMPPTGADGLTPALLDRALEQLVSGFDPRHGGFGGAPKFPQPMLVDFLLRSHRRTGARQPLEMATRTLAAMAAGGMYDQLGGGFHRYSVDDIWLVPHFEKMLYDNALLARAYLDAWQVTHDPRWARVVTEIIGFVRRELTSPAGGFFSSLDADSEGEEGKFYVFSFEEIQQVLGGDAQPFAAAFDVREAGNFEGRNILHPIGDQADALMANARRRLMAARDRRPRPHRDEKVLAAWNGLMLRALAEAGRVLDRPDMLDAARSNAAFLLEHMQVDGRMRRSYKDGRASQAGFLEDQAAVMDGLFSLYEATFEPRWLDAIRSLGNAMLRAFWDEGAATFFDTAQDHEALLVRPRDVTDNATPSGTSMAADILLRAGMLLGEDPWVERARDVLGRLGPLAAEAPLAFGRLLAAMDFALSRPVEIALLGDTNDDRMRALLGELRARYLPNRLIAQAPDRDGGGIPLLRDRGRRDGRATAYLCEGFACQTPTTDAAELGRQLDQVSAR
ncbi:MAG TPA: thioredoxin domain-containing protein [Candidatus Limnocylindrales bacterium]|nr:thioredoxin domain-containing protein [Candidatus Limnocylindrales bacterium]